MRHPSIVAGIAGVLVTTAAPALAGGASPAPTWKRIDPQGQVTGLDGKSHAARCSGYPGTDPKFSFWARTVPKSKNLVVYFEGGGACWDDFSLQLPDRRGPAARRAAVLHPAGDAGHRSGRDAGAVPKRPGEPGARLERRLHPVLHRRPAHRLGVQDLLQRRPPGVPAAEQLHRSSTAASTTSWSRSSGRAATCAKPQQVLVAGVSGGGYGATVELAVGRQGLPAGQAVGSRRCQPGRDDARLRHRQSGPCRLESAARAVGLRQRRGGRLGARADAPRGRRADRRRGWRSSRRSSTACRSSSTAT
ncbi:MAG: hypothetical protein MZW92_48390 [Comamonadaceae bacterium]|nr:hypothetical protein [Comamonadaceae bacterium]